MTSTRGSPRSAPWSPTTTAWTGSPSAFAAVVDAKSPWTYRHSDRVCLIVLGLASAFGPDEDLLRDLRRAALLHDLGKLAISNRILDKPAALTTPSSPPSRSTR